VPCEELNGCVEFSPRARRVCPSVPVNRQSIRRLPRKVRDVAPPWNNPIANSGLLLDIGCPVQDRRQHMDEDVACPLWDFAIERLI